MNQKAIESVVVTGASTGIGRACALHLDKLGFRVFACVRKQKDAENLQQHASERLIQLYLDVTKPESIAAAARVVSTGAGEGGLTGLVNSAGIAIGGPLEFVPIEKLKQQLDVNVTGQIAVTQAFLPMLRRGRGRIVNIGSVSGRVAAPLMGPYASSKFALGALNDALRLELYPWDIHVSIVEPGAIDTPIWDKSLSAADQMSQDLPAQAYDLYGSAMNKTQQTIADAASSAEPVEKVVDAVVHALTAKRPKTRYLVGRSTWAAAFAAKFLSDRIRDRVILRMRGKN
jgi:NAD(P)-dependent dehydrogenase (short-subunit alcohol dehydrogenase family)